MVPWRRVQASRWYLQPYLCAHSVSDQGEVDKTQGGIAIWSMFEPYETSGKFLPFSPHRTAVLDLL